jgi:hypothetical protein
MLFLGRRVVPDVPHGKGNHALLALGGEVLIYGLHPAAEWTRLEIGDELLGSRINFCLIVRARKQIRAELVWAISGIFNLDSALGVFAVGRDDFERHDIVKCKWKETEKE